MSKEIAVIGKRRKRIEDSELSMYRRNAIQAAKELGYPADTIAEIKKAKTKDEISRIMSIARNQA